MKKMILVIVLFFGYSLIASARTGQEGHGGDVVAGMFLGIAQVTLNCMKENPESWKQFPTLHEDLNYVYEHTLVSSSSEPVYLNDQEIDAINYPDSEVPRIIINRGRWLDEDYLNSYRAFLVLHEYLSIAGYNDKNYKISFPLTQKNLGCIKLQVSL